MEHNETSCQLLVIGGSAGSLSVVLKLLPYLPKEKNLSVIIVFHRKSSDDNTLADVLSSRTNYSIKEVDDKDELMPGTIYLAPADYHVLVEKDKTLSLDASEKINYSRPSIDVTFETGAEVFEASLVCMLLSGANADGVTGLANAQKMGAYTIVQNPAWAEVSFMPEHAINRMQPDWIMNADTIHELTMRLT